MTWAPLLLADPSPCLRALALRHLVAEPDEDEIREVQSLRQSDPLVRDVLERQQPDGSWKGNGAVRATSLALLRLGYLGFDCSSRPVKKGAEYLFAQQRKDGGWPMPRSRDDSEQVEGYDWIPLQTAIPLRALAACGFAEDPRAERAFEWLLDKRLDDGVWPTGEASGTHGFVAGYRRLPHSRWGCRSNTTGVLACLALHPTRARDDVSRRALDVLLGRETRERRILGFEVARLVGAEPTRGFMTLYGRFDLGQILDLSWRIGADIHDERIASIVDFVRAAQGTFGIWEYSPQPQVSRWVTFDLLRSLSRIDQDSGWIGLEPRTPFQPYPARRRRY